MREYFYNEKLDILETRTKGILRITDILSHYDKLTNIVNLPKCLKVLIDCRGTKFDIKIDEIALSNDSVKKALNKYKNIQEAILVDKPYETVVATLFKNYNADIIEYRFKIFYTEDAARRWLV